MLGNNCTVLPNVVLGNHCLVAANSAVLSGQEIPERSFVTGIPATVKREVSESQISQMRHTADELAEHAKLFRESGL